MLYYLRTQDEDDTKDFKHRQAIRFHGQRNSGVVIGLSPDTYYYVQVQVFTDAGLGPLGEKNLAETMNPGTLWFKKSKKYIHSFIFRWKPKTNCSIIIQFPLCVVYLKSISWGNMVQCSFVLAPALYPQEVKVVSKDASSVVVSWRGVSTGQAEDSLKGYVVSTYRLHPR